MATRPAVKDDTRPGTVAKQSLTVNNAVRESGDFYYMTTNKHIVLV